jgi:DNA-binding NtrC family response regulator
MAVDPGHVGRLLTAAGHALRKARRDRLRCLVGRSRPPIGSAAAALRRPPLREALTQLEREYLEEALRAHPGNLSAVARTAGMSRVQLYRLVTPTISWLASPAHRC